MAPSTIQAVLCVAAAVFTTSSAFRIDFWLGPHCTSQSLSVTTASGVSNRKCYTVPAEAQAATITREDGDDITENIEFLDGENCLTSQSVASSNAGCIDFTSTGHESVGSFIVSDNRGSPGRRLRIKSRDAYVERDTAPWWLIHQENFRSQLGLHPDNATGSLHPAWDPMAHVNAGFGHGDVTERYGRTWKWQQVALGASIGIPVEDWDDAVHTKSDRFIPFGNDDYEAQLHHTRTCDSDVQSCAFQERDLIMKRWEYAQCRGVLSCGREFASAGLANIGNSWEQTVRAGYKLKTYGQTFYDWAHAHPFSVSITIGTGTTLAGYGLGYSKGGATAQDNDQLAACAKDSTQQNSWIQGFTEAAEAGEETSAEANFTLENGHILTISAEVYPANQPPEVHQCESTAGH